MRPHTTSSRSTLPDWRTCATQTFRAATASIPAWRGFAIGSASPATGGDARTSSGTRAPIPGSPYMIRRLQLSSIPVQQRSRQRVGRTEPKSATGQTKNRCERGAQRLNRRGNDLRAHRLDRGAQRYSFRGPVPAHTRSVAGPGLTVPKASSSRLSDTLTPRHSRRGSRASGASGVARASAASPTRRSTCQPPPINHQIPLRIQDTPISLKTLDPSVNSPDPDS